MKVRSSRAYSVVDISVLYLVSFPRYSESNNGLTLNSGSLKIIGNGIALERFKATVSYSHSIATTAIIFSRFDAIHERDGQTAHDSIGRAYACIARQKLQRSNKFHATHTTWLMATPWPAVNVRPISVEASQ